MTKQMDAVVVQDRMGFTIYVATRRVDFRKGRDGLTAVVEHELGRDLYCGVAVAFRPKRLDRMKVLWWHNGAPDSWYAKRPEWGRMLLRSRQSERYRG